MDEISAIPRAASPNFDSDTLDASRFPSLNYIHVVVVSPDDRSAVQQLSCPRENTLHEPPTAKKVILPSLERKG